MEYRDPSDSLRVFVDLAPGIDGKHGKGLRLAVGHKRNPPATDTRLADAGALGQRRGESRVEWIFGELKDPSADALLRRPVQPVEDLLCFVAMTTL
jgi:hypothetical protein